jgi:hypothetical protein
MAEVFTIGNPSDSKITAFGDDSKYHHTNAFSYVIFENSGLDAARESIVAIKKRYRVPDGVLIHMRQLTNAGYRKKSELGHLNDKLLFQFVSEIIDRMNEIPFFVKGSYFTGELPRNVTDDEFSITWSDKAMQSMLAKSALIPLNLQRYAYPDLKIVVSRDATILAFLGKQRRQAHRWAQGFSDIDAPSGHVYEFEPVILKPEDEVLLQLADVMVYLIAHSFDPERPSLRQRAILEKIRNIDVTPFRFVDY